ncbi:hypothetical protein JTB14_020859 [Gonioctena quinquepunctata]|nr:hypothetical protein JTB14_020859 [Gonioctena quinquepunctata]
MSFNSKYFWKLQQEQNSTQFDRLRPSSTRDAAKLLSSGMSEQIQSSFGVRLEFSPESLFPLRVKKDPTPVLIIRIIACIYEKGCSNV